jgi:hypothetical protein
MGSAWPGWILRTRLRADEGRELSIIPHLLNTVRPYEYGDAAALLADFWTLIGAVLREKRILP